jgi:hypothetical protein
VHARPAQALEAFPDAHRDVDREPAAQLDALAVGRRAADPEAPLPLHPVLLAIPTMSVHGLLAHACLSLACLSLARSSLDRAT